MKNSRKGFSSGLAMQTGENCKITHSAKLCPVRWPVKSALRRRSGYAKALRAWWSETQTMGERLAGCALAGIGKDEGGSIDLT